MENLESEMITMRQNLDAYEADEKLRNQNDAARREHETYKDWDNFASMPTPAALVRNMARLAMQLNPAVVKEYVNEWELTGCFVSIEDAAIDMVLRIGFGNIAGADHYSNIGNALSRYTEFWLELYLRYGAVKQSSAPNYFFNALYNEKAGTNFDIWHNYRNWYACKGQRMPTKWMDHFDKDKSLGVGVVIADGKHESFGISPEICDLFSQWDSYCELDNITVPALMSNSHYTWRIQHMIASTSTQAIKNFGTSVRRKKWYREKFEMLQKALNVLNNTYVSELEYIAKSGSQNSMNKNAQWHETSRVMW